MSFSLLSCVCQLNAYMLTSLFLLSLSHSWIFKRLRISHLFFMHFVNLVKLHQKVRKKIVSGKGLSILIENIWILILHILIWHQWSDESLVASYFQLTSLSVALWASSSVMKLWLQETSDISNFSSV